MILKHDIEAREADRAKLAEQAEQFIQSGGQIKAIPTDRRSETRHGFNNQKKN